MVDKDFAKEVFLQLNKLRKYPKTFIPILEERLRSFQPNNVLVLTDLNGQQSAIQTEEGEKAVSKVKKSNQCRFWK